MRELKRRVKAVDSAIEAAQRTIDRQIALKRDLPTDEDVLNVIEHLNDAVTAIRLSVTYTTQMRSAYYG